MKLLKLMAAAVFALTIAGPASAQTKIYITGSSAFRSVTNAQISSVLSGTVTIASTNATLGSANQVTWTGGNIGGTPVTIKACWTGSAAGVQTVAGSLAVKFLPDGATGTSNPDPTVTGNPNESAIPDVCMSDTYQSTTPFNGTLSGVTYESMSNDFLVGIATFKWVASFGFPANISATPQLVQYLFGSSVGIPLAMFTGSSADETKVVYGTGRNPDSGTRLTTFAESGIGVTSVVKQWKPTAFRNDIGTNDAVTAQVLYPVETINGISTGFPGNSGENSGGSLRAFLNKTLDASAYDPNSFGYTAGYYLTYLGVSDANSATGAAVKPAVSLKYNGVDFSTNAVIEGSYTFWGYEHLMYRSSLAGIKLTFATNLKNNLLAATSATLSPNIALGDMKVSRPTDGGAVSATYF